MSPIPATVQLVLDEYVRQVRANHAEQAVLQAIASPSWAGDVVYELLDTAQGLGYLPRANPDGWFTALGQALPQVAEDLRQMTGQPVPNKVQ